MEYLASRYPLGSMAREEAKIMDRQDVRVFALDCAIRIQAGHEDAEEIVEMAKLFVAFLVDAKQ